MYSETILHLSDIHCGVRFVLNNKKLLGYTDLAPEHYMACKIVNDVVGTLKRHPTLVVVSGDLTEKGTRRQFESAATFLNLLLGEFRRADVSGLDRNSVVIIPGNHDINFADNRKAYQRSRPRKRASLLPEKFAEFTRFFESFYHASSHDIHYQFSKGYHVFRFPKRHLAVVGFDSCREISYAKSKKPGSIANDAILEAARVLDDGGHYHVRLAVFHHNPRAIAEFDEPIQVDSLATARENSNAFWVSGFGLVLHGHRHTNTAFCLIDENPKTQPRLIAVGSASLGSSPEGKIGAVNGYQLIEASFESDKWKIESWPRLLSLVPGKVNKRGRGGFIEDTNVEHSPINSPPPQLFIDHVSSLRESEQHLDQTPNDEEARKTVPAHKKPRESRAQHGQKRSKKATRKEVRKKPDTAITEDPLVTLERIHLMRILASYDEAENELTELSKQLNNKADQVLVDVLLSDLTLLRALDKSLLSNDEKREAWQKLYDRLNDEDIKSVMGLGAFPKWIFESEIVREEFWIARFGAEYWDDFKKSNIQHANALNKVFRESERREYMTCFRQINVLYELLEFSHARQLLREALTVAPAYAPFYISLAQLYVFEMRYGDALEQLHHAKELIGPEFETPIIDFMISYCHYFLGNFEEAERLAAEGVAKWKDDVAFRNNYAFSKGRRIRRDLRDRFWNNVNDAAAILDDFMRSILEIGTNETAHFNYALMLFWAMTEGKIDVARKLMKKYGRSNLLKSPNMVAKAFERARNSYLKQRDYFQAAVSTFFAERAENVDSEDMKDQLLDSLMPDVDNFISTRHSLGVLRRSLLVKNKGIDGGLDFPHIATLKRWMREVAPAGGPGSTSGGGYFLRWNGRGIVLNPGVGFVDSFQRRGYAISEIDAIVVASSHYSAYGELTGLLELVDSAHKHRDSSEKVEVYLEKRVFNRFPDIGIRPVYSITDPQVLSQKETLICADSIKTRLITPCTDCEKRQKGPRSGERYQIMPSILSLELITDEVCVSKLGLISEFCCSEPACSFLNDFNLLIIGVGAVSPYRLFSGRISQALSTCFTKLFTDDPLYRESLAIDENERIVVGSSQHELCCKLDEPNDTSFVGLDCLLRISEYIRSQKKIVILGDLPIELGDKRHKIASVLNQARDNQTMYFTEDTGLLFDLPGFDVMCEFDYSMVPAKDIDEECLDGGVSGPVKHFCAKHRIDARFSKFLSFDY